MGSFSAKGAVIYILCGVCSACGVKIGETGSEKGKEIREDGVEDAKGKEKRVIDCVETRKGSALAVLPVDDKLSWLHASPFLSIFSSKANRRASISSTLCVLEVAFVRFNAHFAILTQSLMPRRLVCSLEFEEALC